MSRLLTKLKEMEFIVESMLAASKSYGRSWIGRDKGGGQDACELS